MTLFELGLEYLRQSNLVRQKIKLLTALLKKPSTDQTELKRRITLLYASAHECKVIGEYLINYNKEEKNATHKV